MFLFRTSGLPVEVLGRELWCDSPFPPSSRYTLFLGALPAFRYHPCGPCGLMLTCATKSFFSDQLFNGSSWPPDKAPTPAPSHASGAYLASPCPPGQLSPTPGIWISPLLLPHASIQPMTGCGQTLLQPAGLHGLSPHSGLSTPAPTWMAVPTSTLPTPLPNCTPSTSLYAAPVGSSTSFAYFQQPSRHVGSLARLQSALPAALSCSPKASFSSLLTAVVDL